MRIVDGELCLDGQALVMGILNVTPDSFSDGGMYLATDRAVSRAMEMEAEGADIIDIGGESTKPGVRPTSLDVECQRVLPVIEQVAKRTSLPVSVDTAKAEVARRAIDVGASMINDVTALRGDPDMATVIARFGAGVILMHMQGTPQDMQEAPTYECLVDEVCTFFQAQMTLANSAGIQNDQILLDPGIGFGKTLHHNLTLLQQLESFLCLGRPLVIGPSRKSFLSQILGCPVDQILMGTAAAVATAIIHGAAIVRVHDVAEMVQVVRIAQSIREAGTAGDVRADLHAEQAMLVTTSETKGRK